MLAPSQARQVQRVWEHPSLSPTTLGGKPEPPACQGHPRMEISAGLGTALVSVPSQLHLDSWWCHKCPALIVGCW